MYWITGILGLALAVAPYLFNYTGNTAAFWTSILIGGAAVAVSFIEGFSARKERWEYWVAAVLGVSAIVAPFVLGFGSLVSAMWTTVGLGLLLALFASTKLFYD